MSTYYVSIGNSDDKLSQKQWAEFVDDIDIVMKNYDLHGRWLSSSDSRFQNACWCFEAPSLIEHGLRPVLALLAGRYGQDSIALATATTEFITAETPWLTEAGR